MNRKKFIFQSAVLAAGLQASSFMKSKKQIGVQLWSLKTAMTDDPVKALAEVAKAGYSFVEPAGHDLEQGTFHNMKPEELKKKVNELGMSMYSAHCHVRAKNAAKVFDQAAAGGLKYVIRPSLSNEERKSIDSYKKVAEEFNVIGEVAKKAGLQFGFHNHANEFAETEGQIPYDILLKNSDPSTVVFQMDLGWVVYAKHSPVEYFNNYPGRFPLWHIRDLDPATRDSVAIGKGDLDYTSIFKAREKAGFKHGIVEISSKDQTNVFDNIRFSHEFLSKARFW